MILNPSHHMRALCALVCVFLACFVAGCEGNEEAAGSSATLAPAYGWGKITGRAITIWGSDHDLKRPFMRRAFERYEKLTGNKLNIVPFSHRELERALNEGFNGAGPKPDVFLYPGGSALLAFNPDENFHNFTKAPWVDDLTDTALSQTISNGRVVGLPHWEAAIAGIIYNKKIFERLRIHPPRNIAEFFEACELLLENGVYPMYLPFTEPSMLLYQFPLSSLLQDNTLLDDLNDNEVTYAELPGMKTIVQWYKSMADRGYFGPNYEKMGWDGMNGAMKSGAYAMMLCWDTWLYTDYDGDPSDFGIMPAFVGLPDEGSFEGPNLSLLIVNEKSPEKDAAIDLVTFMADPYNYNEAFAGMHTAPVFKKQVGSLTTPQYDASARTIERLLRESAARPLIRGFDQSDAVYIEKYMRDPQYSVEDCLRDMDAARLGRISRQTGRPVQRERDHAS